jgi:translocation and assembly module TamB
MSSAARVIRRIAFGIAVLVVLGVVAVYFVARTPGFRRYVIGKVNQKIYESTGGRSEIGDYSIQLRPLVVTVNRLVIHGTEPAGVRPLLETEKVILGVRITSLLSGEVDLTDIEIDHPVINLIVDRNSQSNIPHPIKSSASINVWALGIQRLLIANGEIYYSGKAMPLTAELHDLLARARYDSMREQYVGELSYHRGHLQFGTYRPVDHDLDSHFTASRSGMSFDPLVLRVASSELNLRAAVSNYSHPAVDGDYRVVLQTEDLRHLLRNSSLPLGTITVSGSLAYQQTPGRSPLLAFSSSGRISSPGLLVETSSLRTTIDRISGEYALKNGDFVAHNLRATLLGGELNASLNVRDIAVKRLSSFRASLKDVSIQEAAKTAHNIQAPLTGRAQADLEANWHGSLEGLHTLLNASLKAEIIPSKAGVPPTPLTGTLQVTYAGAGQMLTLTQAQLQTSTTSIRMSGVIGNRSNLQLRAATSNLHELQSLAQGLAPTTATNGGSSFSQLPSVFGTATMNATMEGSFKEPRIAGQLAAQNLQVADTHWRTLRAGFTASPSEITVERGSLVSAGPGTIQFDASTALDDWRYLASSPLSVHLDVAHMPVDQLAPLARLNYPISGILSAQLSLRGSELNPVGTGSLRLTQARLGGTSIPHAALDFQGTGDAVHSTVGASVAGGEINAVLTYYPRNQGYTTRIDVRQLHLEQIEKAQAMGMSGLVSGSAVGRGTLSDPQLSANASIPLLEVRGKTISGISARLEVANQNANFSVNSNIAQSPVEAHGNVALTGEKYATIRLDTRGIALGALLVAFSITHNQEIQGQLEVHATASGPITRPLAMQAQIQIPVLTASYKQVSVAAARPVVANYHNGVVRLEPTEIKGTGTDINLEGSIPVGSKQPANFSATGGIDLSLVHMLDPDLTSTGHVELDIRGSGLAGTPGIHGQVRLVDAGFTSLSAPMGVENVNGVLALTNNEIQIQNVVGHLGGGEFTAAGTVAYRPATQFNVTLKANHVRLLYPEGLRTILQADLLLAGRTQSAQLSGRVLLDNISFSQNFDLAKFMSESSGISSGASPGRGFAENLKLNVAVQSASDLGLMSSEVSLQGSVNLRVTGTAANPVLLGRADITRGELFFMGRRYQVQRGIAQFNNPTHTEPVLNFHVTTTVNQYELNVTLMGPLDRLRTHYVSDPPLPPVDIINLLARGETTEQSAAAPGNIGANQIIASGVASQVSGGIQRLAGISSLQIDPLIGGNNRNPGARLSIQQRVTKNFFFTYSTDVASTQDQIVQGEYQLTRRWSISAIRDQFGNIGVDAKFHKTF